MLTASSRPLSSFPSSCSIAACASSGDDISTKPNPLERPVSRSVIIVAEFTVPTAEKNSLSSSSVVVYSMLPTNNFASSICT